MPELKHSQRPRSHTRRRNTRPRPHAPAQPWGDNVFSPPTGRRYSPHALALTLFVHLAPLLLLLLVPELLEEPKQAAKRKPTKVELVPPPFVQVNPFANQERVRTAQEGAQNQRAAQEADPDPDSRAEGPQLEGEDPRFNRIISGNPEAPDVAPAPLAAQGDSDSPNPPAAGSAARTAGGNSFELQTRAEYIRQQANATPPTEPAPTAAQPTPPEPLTELTPPVPPTQPAQPAHTTQSAPQPQADSTPHTQPSAQPPASMPEDIQPTEDEHAALPMETGQPLLPSEIAQTALPAPEGIPPATEVTQPAPEAIQPAPEVPQPIPSEVAQRTPEPVPGLTEPATAPAPLPPEPQTEVNTTTPAPEPQGTEDTPAIDPNAPRPRPTLEPRISAGPLRHQASAASARGLVAIDSRFSEFGAYQQRMIEAISAQWYMLARQSRAIDSEYGTQVVLVFTMNDQGIVSDTKVRYTNASAAATLLCINAVESRSPFGPWTADMKRVLGDSQTVTFTFYYR